jgi:hypothetical protein
LSVAKKAVDSTIRKILSYTAEIILSIILLIIICLPLVFVVPMWLQHVLLGVPRGSLLLDPVALFGLDGAFWVTSLLGLISVGLGFLFVSRSESRVAEGEDKEGMVTDEEIVDAVLEEIEEEEEGIEEEEEEEVDIEDDEEIEDSESDD